MKRYTGQKALYEAISRSRAKAKRGNILEKFLPEAARQEKPAPEEGQPQVEPISASSDAPPVVKEPPPLPANVVIAVGNCGLYPGSFGVRVEDTVVVTERGPIILTDYPRQLQR